MPDSSDIDAALVAKLQADSALMTVMPDGVFMDEAPPGLTRFVIVSLTDEHDEPMFAGRAIEDGMYLVKAVGLSTKNPDMKTAAARIDALLDQSTLTVPGYPSTMLRRESRLRTVEVDDLDESIRWFHRGGRYQVVAST